MFSIKDIIPDDKNSMTGTYNIRIVIQDKAGLHVASFRGNNNIIGQINTDYFKITTRYDHRLKEKIVVLEMK